MPMLMIIQQILFVEFLKNIRSSTRFCVNFFSVPSLRRAKEGKWRAYSLSTVGVARCFCARCTDRREYSRTEPNRLSVNIRFQWPSGTRPERFSSGFSASLALFALHFGQKIFRAVHSDTVVVHLQNREPHSLQLQKSSKSH